MKQPSGKDFIMLGLVIAMLLSSCQGASLSPTPDAESLSLWGNKNSSVTFNRLGKGVPYAMALSPDGRTIAVSGLVSLSTYDFETLNPIWTSLLKQVQPPVATGQGQVFWSRDGRQIVTMSEIGLTLWDAKTGEQQQVFEQYAYSGVDSILWTQEGRLVVQDQEAGRVFLRDLETGNELFGLDTNDAIPTAAFNQHEELVAIGLSHGVVVWDTRSKEQLYGPLEVCGGYCPYDLQWSPDGTRLAIAPRGLQNEVIIWEVRTGEKLANKGPGNDAEVEMAWSPDSKALAVAFSNDIINIWDAGTGSQLNKLNAKNILDLAWSADGSKLITLGQYESVMIWDVKTHEQLRSVDEHSGWILDMAWSPDGNLLAFTSEDGEIKVWDASTGKTVQSFRPPVRWISYLAWSPDGKKLATASQKTINLWNVKTGKLLKAWHVDSNGVVGLAWSPDGGILTSLNYEGPILLWNPSTGKQLLSLPGNLSSRELFWSPQGDLLATTFTDPEFVRDHVILWEPQSGKPVHTQDGFHDLVWAPQGDIAASIWDDGTPYGGDDTTLVIWDPRTGTEMRRFDTGALISQISWSPDGNFLAVGEYQETDPTLLVMDAQTGEAIHELKGHYDGISGVDWSPRGDQIASSSTDGTVLLWEVEAP